MIPLECISYYDQKHFSGRGLDDVDYWKDYFDCQNAHSLLCFDDKHQDLHKAAPL